METTLQIFKNDDFGKVRAMMIDGEIWFVGKDVAIALGYKGKASANAIKTHVFEQDKLSHQINDSGQRRAMTLINESGLYKLIFSSKLPSAEKFTYWVTSEVLPSIRKTGEYKIFSDDERWLETRKQGKISRRETTNAIKNFIDYARSQGCDWKDYFFYSTLTIWCNVGAGLPQRNGRDNANVQQLNTLDLLERRVIPNVLNQGVIDGLHYTQIWAKAKQQINLFLEVTFSNTPLLT